MTLRFPLYVRILLWFFLNLVLLGVAFYAFFRIEFHLGLDSLLAGPAGERFGSVSELVGYELRESPSEEWTGILRRFTEAYGVRFALFHPDGRELAGDPMAPPMEVRMRLAEFGPMQGPPARRIAPADGTDDAPMSPPEAGAVDPLSPERPPPPGGEKGRGAPRHRPPPRARFMVRTTNPVRYWVGVRIPPRNLERPDGPPQLLLAMSETLSGGGLFLDFKPWLVVGFGAVIVSVLFWLPMVRGITHSISHVTQATEQVANGHFDIRVPANRRDELGRLGQAINHMGARLAGLMTGQKRFLGDVAHELCSPIARIQVALGLLEARAGDKEQPYVEDVREDIQHMSSLVNELLSFSRASLGPSTIKLQSVLLRDVAEQASSRESTGGAQIKLEIRDGLRVMAEPQLLARALSNLLRNAVRYAGQAGPITIAAQPQGGEVLVTISDCGAGVPEAELARIFDPFYRLDDSRDSATGGVGLGLTIVKTCVESCQGTVNCRNRKPSGLEVILRLPASAGA